MIREARLDEVRAVTEFMTRFESCTEHVKVDVDHATKTYERIVKSGMGAMLVLFGEDGAIQGGLGCIKAPDLHFPRMIAVETFWYVGEEFRGKGILLFLAFEEWAKRNGCDACAMIHLSDSYPASLEKFYTRNGYKLVESHYVKELKP